MVNEYEAALAYLAEKQYPEDRWLLESGQQWYKVAEAAPHMGVSDSVLRSASEDGRIPGAVLHGQQIGWRLPHSGLVIYLARLRQQQDQRSGQTG